MEHLGRDVGQIAVQEDEERLDHADVVCEARGKRRYKAQEDADQHPTDPHDKEVRDASKHVNGLNGLHLAERLEQVVQDLWETQREVRTCQLPHHPRSPCLLIRAYLLCSKVDDEWERLGISLSHILTVIVLLDCLQIPLHGSKMKRLIFFLGAEGASVHMGKTLIEVKMKGFRLNLISVFAEMHYSLFRRGLKRK